MRDILLFTVFFAGALGFVVSLVLVFANKAESFSARLLAGFLFSFSFFAIYFGVQTTNFFFRFPHLWKAFMWVSFIYMPISYVYVRSALMQSHRFERWDFLLLLPAILFSASYIPIYIQPASVKLSYLEEIRRHPEYIVMEPHSLFPPWTGFMMRLALGFGCVAGQFFQLQRWKHRTSDNIGLNPGNRELYRWLFNFSIVMGLFYLLVGLQFFFKSLFGKDFGPITLYTILGTILFVCLSLLFKPSILYGMQGWVRRPGTPQPGEAPVPMDPVVITQTEDRKKSYLSAEQGAAMKELLEKHMVENKPYLKPGYSIAQLAQELEIPSYQLSGFINQEYARNFNELVNQYRVNHLLDHYAGKDALSQYTLEAIGREVGFNSRAAFISSVRKITGKTPSELLGRRVRESDRRA